MMQLDWSVLIGQVLLGVLIPMCVAGVKKAVEILEKDLPGWAIPAIAILLGGLLELVAHFGGLWAGSSSGLLAAIGGALGVFGVGVREIYRQYFPEAK